MFVKKMLFLSSLMFFSSKIFSNTLCIYDDAPKQGYGNDDMHTNGEELIIKIFIKPNAVIFDVGANIGKWTEFVLQNSVNPKIFCFEPSPAYATLTKNFAKIDAVTVANVAVDCSCGEREFVFYPTLSVVSAFFVRPRYSALKQAKIKVATVTLDSFCEKNNVNHVDFLKIDTEGAEAAVIDGARGLLDKGMIDCIQFEYGGCYVEAGKKLFDIYRLLKSYGFLIFREVGDGLVQIPAWKDSLENYTFSNYFALKRCIFDSMSLDFIKKIHVLYKSNI